MLFNKIKEIIRLRKQIGRLLSKGIFLIQQRNINSIKEIFLIQLKK